MSLPLFALLLSSTYALGIRQFRNLFNTQPERALANLRAEHAGLQARNQNSHNELTALMNTHDQLQRNLKTVADRQAVVSGKLSRYDRVTPVTSTPLLNQEIANLRTKIQQNQAELAKAAPPKEIATLTKEIADGKAQKVLEDTKLTDETDLAKVADFMAKYMAEHRKTLEVLSLVDYKTEIDKFRLVESDVEKSHTAQDERLKKAKEKNLAEEAELKELKTSGSELKRQIEEEKAFIDAVEVGLDFEAKREEVMASPELIRLIRGTETSDTAGSPTKAEVEEAIKAMAAEVEQLKKALEAEEARLKLAATSLPKELPVQLPPLQAGTPGVAEAKELSRINLEYLNELERKLKREDEIRNKIKEIESGEMVAMQLLAVGGVSYLVYTLAMLI